MRLLEKLVGLVLMLGMSAAVAESEHSEAWFRTALRVCKEQPSAWPKIRENANVHCSDIALYSALIALHKNSEAENLEMTDKQMMLDQEKQKGPAFSREFTNQCYKKYLAGILEKDDDRCWDAINDVGLIDEEEYKKRE